MKICPPLASLVLGLLALPLQAQVVINEIFYHAPDDLTSLQWIELHNPAGQAVDLSGWRVAKGVKFTFAPGSTIAPHGYAILCRNRQLFQEFYPVPVAGEFDKSLRQGGESLELLDQAGHVVDRVEFDDRPPWPRGADGMTASLERICPEAPGDLPENWAGSPLSTDATQPGGSPGEKNAAFSNSLPPVIGQVSFPSNGVAPQQLIRVLANVQGKTALKEVMLHYRVLRSGSLGDERRLPMTQAGSGARYSADIPGQEAGQIVRFRIQAVDQNGAERFHPGSTEPRPAFSCLVFTNFTPGRIPLGYLIHPDPEEAESALRQARNGGRGGPPGPEVQARFMVQMQFRAALDLPVLWASLTLSNPAPAAVEQLRPVFAKHEAERAALEKKTLAAADPEDALRHLPDLTKPYKVALGESLKPVLSSDQWKTFEAWRDTGGARPGPGGPGGDPSTMLRQFIRLEPDYLHLATRTNVTAAQLASLRDLYRDAIQQRDALVPALARLVSGNPDRNQAEGQQFEAKAMAIPAAVETRLRTILTPAQSRQFSDWQTSEQPPFMRRGGNQPPEPPQGQSAFVLVDPVTRQPRLFDFVHIPERSGGWKVHFARDDTWNGMTAIDLIFEASERWLVAESLAYEFHRRAGLAASRTDFVRLDVDGQPVGYRLLIEHPNKAFLRQHHVRSDGNLYKATYAGNGVEGTHEKRTNRRTGHDDLIQLVDALEKTRNQPDEQWSLIRREFDAEEVINHYAVRTLISDWDGFFNNYFLYHDLHGTRKWTLYPWDEDKTWGEYDGWEQSGPLYNLPMTYAAEGDHPPGEPGGRPSEGYGFRQWWRPGGYISRPLLANSIFRRHFLARLKGLLGTEFTEERLNPLVDGYRARLQEEVRYSAQLSREDPDQSQRRFESHLDSIKEFISKRRQWLLEQEEIRTAAPFEHSEVR